MTEENGKLFFHIGMYNRWRHKAHNLVMQFHPERIGLQFRLTLLTAGGLIVLFIVVAILEIRTVQTRSEQIQHERLIIAQTIAGELDQNLNHAAQLLELTAMRSEIDLGDDTQQPEIAALREAYNISHLPTHRLILVDIRGRVLLTYPDDQTLVDAELGTFPFVQQTLRSSSEQINSNDIGPIPHSHDYHISSILPQSLFGQPTISIGVPISDENGETSGALLHTVNFQDPTFSEALRYIREGNTGFAELVTSDGTVVAGTPAHPFLQDWKRTAPTDEMLRSENAHADIYSTDAGSIFVAVAPLSTVPWQVVVAQPVSEALAPVRQLHREFIVLGLAIFIVACAFVWYITKRIVHPVQELTDATRRISTGDLHHPIAPKGEEEIQKLAHAFEDMRMNLVTSRESMQQRTRELTVLHQTALAGSEAKDADELLRRVTDVLTADLYPENIGFLFVDETGSFLQPHSSYHGISTDLYDMQVPIDESVTGRVAQTGRPQLIHDIADCQFYFEGMTGVSAELCAPVRAGGDIVGVINVESAEPAAFSKKDLHLVSAVANHVGTVLEKLQSIEEARRRTTELEALRMTTLDLMAQLDLSGLLRGIVRRATELLEADGGLLHLYDEEHARLEVAVSHNLARDYSGTSMHAGEGLSGRVVMTGQPLVVDKYQTWEGRSEHYPDQEFGGMIGVPMYWHERMLGVINLIHFEEDRTFSDNDITLLEAFAQQASVAIENARLYEAVQVHARELETLHRTSLTLTQSLELEDVLDAILAGAFALLTHADDAHIFLYRAGRLEFAAARFSDGRQETPWSEPRQDGLTYTVARQGETIVVPDMQQHPIFEKAPSNWTGAIIGVPLKIGERVVGVMNVAFLQPQNFSEEELHLLELLGDRAAIAIENARLFEAEHASRRRAETLQQVAAVLGSTLEVEELMNRVLKELQKVVPYESASVQLLRGDYVEVIAGRGFDDVDKHIGRCFPIDGDTPDKEIIRTKEPLLVADTHREYPKFTKSPYKYIRSWLGAPLLHKGEVIGLITLDRQDVDAFKEEEIRIAMTFANHVAIALENARLYERAQHRATTDGLTDLYNSRYFYEHLEEELERSRRYDHPCSVIILDLDNFKRYNDRYGHLTGDDLLRDLAGILNNGVRETDVVARYGGEEFTIILPETDAEQAYRLAERLRTTIRAHEFVVRDAQQVGRITISAGVATYPQHADEPEALVQKADIALLRAKETKDRVCVAE